MNDYKELIEDIKAHCLCIIHDGNCENCEGLSSEKPRCSFTMQLLKKAADAIEQLVRERDAVIADLRVVNPCVVCKHFSKEYCWCDAFYECAVEENDLWEWRGVQ